MPVWVLGGGVSGLIALDYWRQWGYMGALSSAVFDSLLGPGGPVLALALLVATCLLFGLTCRLLKDHLHDEASSEKGFTTKSQSLLDWLAGLGPVGQLMALEIKLAIRNKRPPTNPVVCPDVFSGRADKLHTSYPRFIRLCCAHDHFNILPYFLGILSH